MPVKKTGCKLRVPGKSVVPRVRGEVAVQVWVVAQQLVGYAAAFDLPRGVRCLVRIIRADVCPEGIRVADEPGLRIRFQHRFEVPESGGENTLCRCMRNFLEVNQNRDIQLCCERIHSTQLGTGGFYVEFQFAESGCAALDGARENLLRAGPGDVRGGKPSQKAARILCADRSYPVRADVSCEEERIGNPATIQMRNACLGCAPHVVVAIDNGIAGPRLGRLSIDCAGRTYGSRDGARESAAGQFSHWLLNLPSIC